MMLRVVILESKEQHYQHLRSILEAWEGKTGNNLHITYLQGSAGLTDELIQGNDIFFIAIPLAGADSMETAKYIRCRSKNVPIVFAADFMSYALDGYIVHAERYLLKPLRAEDCFFCMGQALRYAQKRDAETVLLHARGKVVRIRLFEILYIEAQVRHIKVVTTGSAAVYTQTFARTVKQLYSPYFVQCHRSYLVNLRHIRMVQGGQLFLDNGERIPIGRAYQETVQRVLEQAPKV